MNSFLEGRKGIKQSLGKYINNHEGNFQDDSLWKKDDDIKRHFMAAIQDFALIDKKIELAYEKAW